MRLALPLIVFALLSARPAPARPPVWYWPSPAEAPTTLRLDLIRAYVRIIRRDGPVQIASERRDGFGRAAEVRLVTEQDGNAVTVRDVYPEPLAGHWDECLPPAGRHGDFWTTAATFFLTISAPRATRILVDLLQGQVEEDDR